MTGEDDAYVLAPGYSSERHSHEEAPLMPQI